MASFSRALRRWTLFQVAPITLVVAWVAVLAAFAYAAAGARPDLGTVVGAALLLGIAAACFLYAWREPGA